MPIPIYTIIILYIQLREKILMKMKFSIKIILISLKLSGILVPEPMRLKDTIFLNRNFRVLVHDLQSDKCNAAIKQSFPFIFSESASDLLKKMCAIIY